MSVIERVDRTVLRQLIQPNFSKAIVADDSIPFFDELSSHSSCFRFLCIRKCIERCLLRRYQTYDLVLRVDLARLGSELTPRI
jgi:hypothetical protein